MKKCWGIIFITFKMFCFSNVLGLIVFKFILAELNINFFSRYFSDL